MILRLSLAVSASLALLGSACAAEKPDTAAPAVVTATASVDTGFYAPDTAWRDVDQANALYVDTNHGQIIVEMFPEIAPRHVTQIKALTQQKFYDYITFHRVIDGFMNQTGDPKGDGTGDSDLPDIEAEFSFRRAPSMGVTLIGSRPFQSREIPVGFYKGLAVTTQPTEQADWTKDGKVAAFALHCKGVTSMARSSNPNSGNSQFFLMRGTATHLDAQYSIWGNSVWGREHLTKIKIGAKADDPAFVPDTMDKVRIGTDVPVAERVNVQVLDTNSIPFSNYLRTLKNADGSYPDICDIEIPTRIKPPA